MSRRNSFLVCALVALLVVLAAYSDSLHNAFHFDDSHVVESNLFVRSLTNLPRFFTDASTFSSFPANATYRPLVTTSLAIDYWFAGSVTNLLPFHVSQILMLVVLGALLVWLYRRILDEADPQPWNGFLALATATFFCVQTTDTETMNLMHARSELISAIGVVGSFLLYIEKPKLRATYLYLVPMILGALAKDPSVIFAPLLIVYIFLFEQQSRVRQLVSKDAWRVIWPPLKKGLPALVVGALVFVFVESMNGPGSTYGGGSRVDYLQTQMWVWLHYGRMFFLPIGLTADTDWGLIRQWYDTRVLAGVAFAVATIWAMSAASERKPMRAVAFGLAWFLLALLPASSIFPLAEVSNDHRMFFPFIGLSLAVFSFGAETARQWANAAKGRQQIATVAAVTVIFVAILGNAVGTYERNQTWKNGESLWKDVAEKSPGNGRGLMNYGLTHMSVGRYQEASDLFERAHALLPNYPTLEINRGIVADRLGRPEEAEADFNRALALEPNYPASHYFFARWLTEKGRYRDAIPHLTRALALSPADLSSRQLLLETYAGTGQLQELHALAAATLQLVPNDLQATKYLNWQGGDLAPEPVQAAPTAASLLDQSLRLYRAADYAGSLAAAQKALAMQPNWPEAYNNMAAANASLGKWDAAIAAAQEALRLKPDFPLARNNLAWAEGEKRKQNP